MGTVEKIAKKVASRLDRQQDNRQIRYASNLYADDGYAWPSGQVIAMPPQTAFREIQSGALEAKCISNVEGLLSDAIADNLPLADREAITCYCKGVQMKFALQNRNSISCRVQCALIFMPNVNYSTQDAVDFMRPDQYMLYRFGGGGLQYEGWASREIRNLASGQASVRKFSVLAHKKLTLPGTVNSGYTTGGQQQRISTRFVTLTKHFKGQGKKHNIKPRTQTQPNQYDTFSDGSYYFLIWSDLPATDTLFYLGQSNIKLLPAGTTASINQTIT